MIADDEKVEDEVLESMKGWTSNEIEKFINRTRMEVLF